MLRKSFKTNDFITYLQDILFWIISGILILLNIYKFNSGEIRIFIFVGIILGVLLYMLTISKLFIKINVSIIRFFTNIMKKFFVYPIKFILNIIINPIFSLIKKLRQIFTIKFDFFVKIRSNLNKKTEGF